MNEDIVIVDAGRTAIGILCGAISSLSAASLGGQVIAGLLHRSNVSPREVDQVVMGQVLTAGCGQNPARQAALQAGLPVSSTAYSVNQICGSGLLALQLARQSILLGDADIIIAGGQESMSQAPHILPGTREGHKFGHWEMKDSMLSDGLWDAFFDCHIGLTAENIAAKYGITREHQDEYAILSQKRASAAQRGGRFGDEIIPVNVPQRRGADMVFTRDEAPRPGSTRDMLAGLCTSFKPDGSVTGGNASGLSDGAAALLLMKAGEASRRGLPVLARIKAFASAGVAPDLMGTGPVPATRKCLEKAGWSVGEVDLFEANESFAAQTLYVAAELGIGVDQLNVNGGAIALGHPIGASGARILTTLGHEMKKRDAKKGLATLCISGGMGIAMAIERDG